VIGLRSHGLLFHLFAFSVRKFSAIRAQDVLLISNETLANQVLVATRSVTIETVIMPMTTIERNELRSTNTGDGLVARIAAFGELLSEACSAIWLVIPRSKLLSDQIVFAFSASKTVSVVRLVSVQDTSSHDWFSASFL
jgi:hypothetical protein